MFKKKKGSSLKALTMQIVILIIRERGPGIIIRPKASNLSFPIKTLLRSNNQLVDLILKLIRHYANSVEAINICRKIALVFLSGSIRKV